MKRILKSTTLENNTNMGETVKIELSIEQANMVLSALNTESQRVGIQDQGVTQSIILGTLQQIMEAVNANPNQVLEDTSVEAEAPDAE
jgi:hypothetical protein